MSQRFALAAALATTLSLPIVTSGPHTTSGAATAPLAPLSALDSVGASALVTALGLLPATLPLPGLRLERYRAAVADVRNPVLGPFGIAFEGPARADGLTAQFSFEWSVEDVLAQNVPEDPALGSVFLNWTGRDVGVASAIYGRIYDALRTAPMAPWCVNLGSDITQPDFVRRSREAAWRAGEWNAAVFVRTSRDSVGLHYLIQYRASRNPVFALKPAEPAKSGWDCLPRLPDVP